MQKALKLARTISSKIEADHSEAIEDINLHWVFQPLEDLQVPLKERNTLIAAIIYSYDNESTWIDLKQDGQSINTNILKGLKAELNRPIYSDFLNQKNEKINEAIGNYLDVLGDWKFTTVRKHIDYHAKYIRQTENEADFEGLDAAKKNAAREAIGKLMREAVNHRKTADELIEKLHKDYVATQHRVNQSFDASFVDESIRLDPYSWRDFIKHRYEPMQERKKAAKQGSLGL